MPGNSKKEPKKINNTVEKFNESAKRYEGVLRQTLNDLNNSFAYKGGFLETTKLQLDKIKSINMDVLNEADKRTKLAYEVLLRENEVLEKEAKRTVLGYLDERVGIKREHDNKALIEIENKRMETVERIKDCDEIIRYLNSQMERELGELRMRVENLEILNYTATQKARDHIREVQNEKHESDMKAEDMKKDAVKAMLDVYARADTDAKSRISEVRIISSVLDKSGEEVRFGEETNFKPEIAELRNVENESEPEISELMGAENEFEPESAELISAENDSEPQSDAKFDESERFDEGEYAGNDEFTEEFDELDDAINDVAYEVDDAVLEKIELQLLEERIEELEEEHAELFEENEELEEEHAELFEENEELEEEHAELFEENEEFKEEHAKLEEETQFEESVIKIDMQAVLTPYIVEEEKVQAVQKEESPLPSQKIAEKIEPDRVAKKKERLWGILEKMASSSVQSKQNVSEPVVNSEGSNVRLAYQEPIVNLTSEPNVVVHEPVKIKSIEELTGEEAYKDTFGVMTLEQFEYLKKLNARHGRLLYEEDIKAIHYSNLDKIEDIRRKFHEIEKTGEKLREIQERRDTFQKSLKKLDSRGNLNKKDYESAGDTNSAKTFKAIMKDLEKFKKEGESLGITDKDSLYSAIINNEKELQGVKDKIGRMEAEVREMEKMMHGMGIKLNIEHSSDIAHHSVAAR